MPPVRRMYPGIKTWPALVAVSSKKHVKKKKITERKIKTKSQIAAPNFENSSSLYKKIIVLGKLVVYRT